MPIALGSAAKYHKAIAVTDLKLERGPKPEEAQAIEELTAPGKDPCLHSATDSPNALEVSCERVENDWILNTTYTSQGQQSTVNISSSESRQQLELGRAELVSNQKLLAEELGKKRRRAERIRSLIVMLDQRVPTAELETLGNLVEQVSAADRGGLDITREELENIASEIHRVTEGADLPLRLTNNKCNNFDDLLDSLERALGIESLTSNKDNAEQVAPIHGENLRDLESQVVELAKEAAAEVLILWQSDLQRGVASKSQAKEKLASLYDDNPCLPSDQRELDNLYCATLNAILLSKRDLLLKYVETAIDQSEKLLVTKFSNGEIGIEEYLRQSEDQLQHWRANLPQGEVAGLALLSRNAEFTTQFCRRELASMPRRIGVGEKISQEITVLLEKGLDLHYPYLFGGGLSNEGLNRKDRFCDTVVTILGKNPIDLKLNSSSFVTTPHLIVPSKKDSIFGLPSWCQPGQLLLNGRLSSTRQMQVAKFDFQEISQRSSVQIERRQFTREASDEADLLPLLEAAQVYGYVMAHSEISQLLYDRSESEEEISLKQRALSNFLNLYQEVESRSEISTSIAEACHLGLETAWTQLLDDWRQELVSRLAMGTSKHIMEKLELSVEAYNWEVASVIDSVAACSNRIMTAREQGATPLITELFTSNQEVMEWKEELQNQLLIESRAKLLEELALIDKSEISGLIDRPIVRDVLTLEPSVFEERYSALFQRELPSHGLSPANASGLAEEAFWQSRANLQAWLAVELGTPYVSGAFAEANRLLDAGLCPLYHPGEVAQEPGAHLESDICLVKLTKDLSLTEVAGIVFADRTIVNGLTTKLSWLEQQEIPSNAAEFVSDYHLSLLAAANPELQGLFTSAEDIGAANVIVPQGTVLSLEGTEFAHLFERELFLSLQGEFADLATQDLEGPLTTELESGFELTQSKLRQQVLSEERQAVVAAYLNQLEVASALAPMVVGQANKRSLNLLLDELHTSYLRCTELIGDSYLSKLLGEQLAAFEIEACFSAGMSLIEQGFHTEATEYFERLLGASEEFLVTHELTTEQLKEVHRLRMLSFRGLAGSVAGAPELLTKISADAANNSVYLGAVKNQIDHYFERALYELKAAAESPKELAAHRAELEQARYQILAQLYAVSGSNRLYELQLSKAILAQFSELDCEELLTWLKDRFENDSAHPETSSIWQGERFQEVCQKLDLKELLQAYDTLSSLALVSAQQDADDRVIFYENLLSSLTTSVLTRSDLGGYESDLMRLLMAKNNFRSLEVNSLDDGSLSVSTAKLESAVQYLEGVDRAVWESRLLELEEEAADAKFNRETLKYDTELATSAEVSVLEELLALEQITRHGLLTQQVELCKRKAKHSNAEADRVAAVNTIRTLREEYAHRLAPQLEQIQRECVALEDKIRRAGLPHPEQSPYYDLLQEHRAVQATQERISAALYIEEAYCASMAGDYEGLNQALVEVETNFGADYPELKKKVKEIREARQGSQVSAALRQLAREMNSESFTEAVSAHIGGLAVGGIFGSFVLSSSTLGGLTVTAVGVAGLKARNLWRGRHSIASAWRTGLSDASWSEAALDMGFLAMDYVIIAAPLKSLKVLRAGGKLSLLAPFGRGKLLSREAASLGIARPLNWSAKREVLRNALQEPAAAGVCYGRRMIKVLGISNVGAPMAYEFGNILLNGDISSFERTQRLLGLGAEASVVLLYLGTLRWMSLRALRSDGFVVSRGSQASRDRVSSKSAERQLYDSLDRRVSKERGWRQASADAASARAQGMMTGARGSWEGVDRSSRLVKLGEIGSRFRQFRAAVGSSMILTSSGLNPAGSTGTIVVSRPAIVEVVGKASLNRAAKVPAIIEAPRPGNRVPVASSRPIDKPLPKGGSLQISRKPVSHQIVTQPVFRMDDLPRADSEIMGVLGQKERDRSQERTNLELEARRSHLNETVDEELEVSFEDNTAQNVGSELKVVSTAVGESGIREVGRNPSAARAVNELRVESSSGEINLAIPKQPGSRTGVKRSDVASLENLTESRAIAEAQEAASQDTTSRGAERRQVGLADESSVGGPEAKLVELGVAVAEGKSATRANTNRGVDSFNEAAVELKVVSTAVGESGIREVGRNPSAARAVNELRVENSSEEINLAIPKQPGSRTGVKRSDVASLENLTESRAIAEAQEAASQDTTSRGAERRQVGLADESSVGGPEAKLVELGVVVAEGKSVIRRDPGWNKIEQLPSFELKEVEAIEKIVQARQEEVFQADMEQEANRAIQFEARLNESRTVQPNPSSDFQLEQEYVFAAAVAEQQRRQQEYQKETRKRRISHNLGGGIWREEVDRTQYHDKPSENKIRTERVESQNKSDDEEKGRVVIQRRVLSFPSDQDKEDMPSIIEVQSEGE